MQKSKPNPGIDYGMGVTNIDPDTGIRFGVIMIVSLMPEAAIDIDIIFPPPICENCEQELEEDYTCPACNKQYDEWEFMDMEPIGLEYSKDGYMIMDCLDTDLFIMKSPYYTECSPCVPGAGNLDSPMEGGVKSYCLGPDWFEDNKAPYPVYEVKTGKRVA